MAPGPILGTGLSLPGPGPIIVVIQKPEVQAAGAAYTPVDPLGTSGFFGV